MKRQEREKRRAERTVAKQCSPIVETWIPLALLRRERKSATALAKRGTEEKRKRTNAKLIPSAGVKLLKNECSSMCE